jgi:uncharacterized protein YbjT (DUF2867 family)
MTIFVTGATGTTGSETVKELQKLGTRIRVGVRNLEKAKTTLSGPNTEFVPFDFERPDTWGEALRGCERLYLGTAMDRLAHDHAISLIDASLTHGINHIVRLSAIGADMVPGITLGRWHRTAERYLQTSGASWTILRPAAFMSNFGLYWGSTIKTENKIYLPLGLGKVSWIDPRDVGAVAAKVLSTNLHLGKIYTLTGGESLDVNNVAKILSDVVGKTISYVDVPEMAARDSMKKMGMPDWSVQAMTELLAVFKNNYAAGVTQDVEMVLGRKALTFAQFARDYVKLFK